MSNIYLIKFVSLESNISIKLATTILLTRFNFSPPQAEQFLSGKLTLSSQSYKKIIILKQRFKQYGILVTTDAQSEILASDESVTDIDKRIVNALDYITTSMIRLEDKVDDLARQQQAQSDDDELSSEHTNNWVEELTTDNTESMTIKTAKIKWLFILMLVVLLLLLVAVIAFPNLLPF